MQNNSPDTAHVIAPPPLIFGAFLLGGLLLQYFWPLRFLPRMVAVVLAVAMIGAGYFNGHFAHREMARQKTPINPLKPTTALVTNGPYRFSRNPLYLSLLLFYLGLAALFNSLWIVVLVVPLLAVMQRGVIAREEIYLERKFGDEYRQYKACVRRWI